MAIHAQRIEKHVLAGFLNFSDLVIEVDSWVSEKDFYVKEHQTIFSVIRNTVIEGEEEVDNVLIANKINNLGITFEKINIFDYLRALKGITITRKNALASCQELSKVRISRELDQTLDESKSFIKENLNSDIDTILTGCDQIYNSKLDSYTLKEEPQDLFDDMEDFIEEIGNNPHEETGLATGFKEFNRLYGGLRPQNLYAIVARPGQGKSTWILDVCRKTAKKHNVPTLILDTEMSTEDIKFRVAAAESGVSLWHLETGNWRRNSELVEKVRNSYDAIKNQCIYHYPVGNKNIDQICSFVRRFYYSEVGRGNPFILGYDYIKLTGERVGNNWAEHQAIGDKIDKLKKLSEELNCPIITAMQMNRSGENFNRRAGAVVDDSSAISLSDRLQWFASFVAIFRRKTLDEIAEDGEDFGTHKLVPLKTRFQGRDAAGHHDLVRRVMPDGTVRFTNNFLNFNVSNFNTEEVGSLSDIVNRERDQHDLDDPAQSDGELL